MPIYLYLVHITKPEDHFIHKIIPFLPKNSQIKILKNRFPEDQWRAILSDLLLRKILAQELNVSSDTIQIDVDSYGKPFLKEKKRHFNLSHSGNIIVLATDDSPIGIDIECIRLFKDLDQLLTQFSQEEKCAYQEKPEERRVDFFYELWTLKESYIKALGKGLRSSLDSFNIRVSDTDACLTRGVDSDISWYFKRYLFGNQYRCAVCARHNRFPEEASIIETENLIGLYR